MGYGSWSARDYATLASTSTAASSARSHREVFKSNSLHSDLDPKKFGPLGRESRDSAANPQSTPIILALDVTGSMGDVARQIAATGLSALITAIFDKKPVTDPHIAFAGVGDVVWDQAPFQMSQFETDATMIQHLEKLYLEGRGGGNQFESYNLPWYAAHFKTTTDARSAGRKGFIFTFGDELPPDSLTADQLENVFGPGQYSDVSNAQLLEALADDWHVYHLIIEQGNGVRCLGEDRVKETWQRLMGQNAIPVSDYTKLGEIIVSIMQIASGEDAKTVAAEWGGSTAVVVGHATQGLTVKRPAQMELLE